MAIVATNLDLRSDTNGITIVSNSISPNSNELLLATISQRTNISIDPNQPTLTGNGLTWELVNTIVFDAASTSRRRVSLFRALGASPSAGAVTADFGLQVNTHSIIIIDQLSGIDTGGTNGSDAIVQSATNSTVGTSLSVTLAAFGSASNATYGAIGTAATGTELVTAGSGFTITNQINNGGAQGGAAEFRNDPDTTVDYTNPSSVELGIVGAEIKAAGGAATPTFIPRRMMVGIG